MPAIDGYTDDQAQSEVYDETHIDDEGDGDILPDEAAAVLDVTQMAGDGDEEAFDEDADPDPDEIQGAAGIEAEADALLGVDGERLTEIDGESAGQRGADEVELVYTGLMRNVRGAQASAAHWEAKRLSDDDIAGLGYGPDGDEDHPAK
ncbi:MAG: hypothetical protein KKC29_12865 [Alphaproteobacteria bacterium]|jgi:hypothetical protein|nr:hypothetical protein [Alphaproteobacteria bacterium]MBU2042016.1 hypothetical protein [Alphaproteobacteria bacterium]MBU2127294.1 hypothetical protein [Alphaproteobacteria bacterium]MBU2208799.1 hypothetical protein [Alphaproteobacteria bacterium]MBU2291982.1 hypothetical protein [Alphaproteobacteria bacterium]